MVKVCFVTANHPPEAWGGTEQVVVALSAALQARGADVMVVSGSDAPHAGVDVRAERHAGIPVHRLFRRADEGDQQGFVRPRLLALLRELLRDARPDVVHVQSAAALGLGIAAIAGELGAPMVMTFHDLWVTCARYFRVPVGGAVCPTGTDRAPCVRCLAHEAGMAATWVAGALAERDRLVRAEVAAAAACTAPSATAAAFVRDCLPFAGAIEVIPHGLLRPVPAADRALPPQPGERLRIGTFGGLVPEKGVLELADAAAGIDCELLLAGRLYAGDLLAAIRAREARGLRWRYDGPYAPGDPHPARLLHLAVFPSKCQETYGLVVDEALAHGVPAVVSDAGALAERRGQGGVIVTPLPQLGRVLRELVGSPERLAALRAAIPAELPSMATAADRHLELYRRLR